MVRIGLIIEREILKKGYKNGHEFCLKEGIKYRNYQQSVVMDRWTSELLGKIGAVLGLDLKKFANAKDRGKYVRKI